MNQGGDNTSPSAGTRGSNETTTPTPMSQLRDEENRRDNSRRFATTMRMRQGVVGFGNTISPQVSRIGQNFRQGVNTMLNMPPRRLDIPRTTSSFTGTGHTDLTQNELLPTVPNRSDVRFLKFLMKCRFRQIFIQIRVRNQI